MENKDTHDLIDIALAACMGSDSAEGYGLIAVNSAYLGAVGVRDIVRTAVASGRYYRTAWELSADGAGLRTLVLADITSEGRLAKNLWILDGWSLLRAYGNGADLRGVCLRGAQLRGAQLKGADLREADLCGADLEKADLSYSNLTGANLAGSILFSTSLQGANLTETELCRADLRHADLRESICIRTAFRGADLWGTYMWDVDISQAFTEGTDFNRADYLNKKTGGNRDGTSQSR